MYLTSLLRNIISKDHKNNYLYNTINELIINEKCINSYITIEPYKNMGFGIMNLSKLKYNDQIARVPTNQGFNGQDIVDLETNYRKSFKEHVDKVCSKIYDKKLQKRILRAVKTAFKFSISDLYKFRK